MKCYISVKIILTHVFACFLLATYLAHFCSSIAMHIRLPSLGLDIIIYCHKTPHWLVFLVKVVGLAFVCCQWFIVSTKQTKNTMFSNNLDTFCAYFFSFNSIFALWFFLLFLIGSKNFFQFRILSSILSQSNADNSYIGGNYQDRKYELFISWHWYYFNLAQFNNKKIFCEMWGSTLNRLFTFLQIVNQKLY